jgi:hypothetical protein
MQRKTSATLGIFLLVVGLLGIIYITIGPILSFSLQSMLLPIAVTLLMLLSCSLFFIGNKANIAKIYEFPQLEPILAFLGYAFLIVIILVMCVLEILSWLSTHALFLTPIIIAIFSLGIFFANKAVSQFMEK